MLGVLRVPESNCVAESTAESARTGLMFQSVVPEMLAVLSKKKRGAMIEMDVR